MTKSRLVHCFLCFILLFAIVGGLAGNRVYAQPETPLQVTCDYPVVPGQSGDRFEFMIDLRWYGPEGETINLITTAPPQWIATTTKIYPEEEIGALWMKEFQTYPTQLKVILTPVPGYQPEPGEYVVTLDAVSDDGEREDSLELKAIVTARYEYKMVTATGKLNIEATAGKDNPLLLLVENMGTEAVTNISFSSTRMENWGVTFSPEKIDALEPGSVQEVNVVIKPPGNRTIAGDYFIILGAESTEYALEPLQIRVTILTPAIWNWVGILIVVVVVLGLVLLFWQLSNR